MCICIGTASDGQVGGVVSFFSWMATTRLSLSVEPDEAFDRAAEEWLHTAAASAHDALKADPSRVIRAESVRARFEPSGPPVHDGLDQLHPRSPPQQQLHDLDDWITKAASAEVGQRFVSAVMNHIDGVLAFPNAGQGRDDAGRSMTHSCVANARPEDQR